MRIVLVCILSLAATLGHAHPSPGIVVDNEGKVYFTDPTHSEGTLWSMKDEGSLTEILTRFHAHNLFIDGESNIWLAASLPARHGKRKKHTLIKITPEQQVDTLISTFNKAIFSGTYFTIGPDGAIYFENENKVWKYNGNGPELFINHQFSMIKGMMMDKDGTLWIADSGFAQGSLFKYKDGQMQKFASHLMPKSPEYPLFKAKQQQYLNGIAQDGQGNIYVTENAGCRIIKFNKAGKQTVFYESPALWSPVDVAFYHGDAYIIETGFDDGIKGPRVIKKSPAGISRVVNIDNVHVSTIKRAHDKEPFIIPTWVYFGLGLLIFSLVVILSVKRQYNNV